VDSNWFSKFCQRCGLNSKRQNQEARPLSYLRSEVDWQGKSHYLPMDPILRCFKANIRTPHMWRMQAWLIFISIFRSANGQHLSNDGEKWYWDIRGKWEPCYNYDYNLNHDCENWIIKPKKLIFSILSKSMNATHISILDIGRDRGKYVPDFPKSKKYVLKLS